jgi:hypothetical protein
MYHIIVVVCCFSSCIKKRNSQVWFFIITKEKITAIHVTKDKRLTKKGLAG